MWVCAGVLSPSESLNTVEVDLPGELGGAWCTSLLSMAQGVGWFGRCCGGGTESRWSPPLSGSQFPYLQSRDRMTTGGPGTGGCLLSPAVPGSPPRPTVVGWTVAPKDTTTWYCDCDLIWRKGLCRYN